MRSKQHGLLMLGITFIASGILAVVMKHWWPLLAGFAMAWVLRAMGMDPLPPTEVSGEQPPAQAQAPAVGEDKKT